MSESKAEPVEREEGLPVEDELAPTSTEASLASASAPAAAEGDPSALPDLEEDDDDDDDEDGLEEGEEDAGPSVPVDLKLKREWTLWYDPGEYSAKDWFGTLKEVVTFSTVGDFWRAFNHIKAPSQLKTATCYYLFVKGVKPMYEDPVNKYGGMWRVDLNSEEIDNYWKLGVLAAIGESMKFSDHVLGVAASIKKTGKHRFNVWTKDCMDKEAITSIGYQLKDSIIKSKLKFNYLPHNTTDRGRQAKDFSGAMTI